MEYQGKSPGMSAFLNNLFPHTDGQCPTCGKQVDMAEFRDALSRKEYGISHMCMSCQDEVFGSEETGPLENKEEGVGVRLYDPQDSWPHEPRYWCGDEERARWDRCLTATGTSRQTKLKIPPKRRGEEEYARYESGLEPYGMDYLYDGGGLQWP